MGGVCSWPRAVVEDLLGWRLDESKRSVAATSAKILGVLVSIVDNREVRREPPARRRRRGPPWQGQAMEFRLDDARAEALAQEIVAILDRGWLPPSRAAKLAGKLSFGACAVFGRSARCFLVPLFAHAHQSRWVVSRRLRAALEWWARFLPCVPRRVVPLWPVPHRERVILYTDATGSGRCGRAATSAGRAQLSRGAPRLAYVIDAPGMRVFAATAVPCGLRRWVLPRKTQARRWTVAASLLPPPPNHPRARGPAEVAAWELVAAAVGIRHVLQIAPGAEVLAFVDSAVGGCAARVGAQRRCLCARSH